MRRVSLLMSGTLAVLVLAWGCGSETVTRPIPQAPVVLHDGYVAPNPDTTYARSLGVVTLRFTWETDVASTDVLVYGPRPDSLRDSLVAENIDSHLPDGTPKHWHEAPPSTAPAFQRGTGVEFFYRVLSRSKDAAAPPGYSPIWRFVTFDPRLGSPGQLTLWRAN